MEDGPWMTICKGGLLPSLRVALSFPTQAAGMFQLALRTVLEGHTLLPSCSCLLTIALEMPTASHMMIIASY